MTLAVHQVGEGRTMLFQHGLCGDAGQTAEVFPDGIGWRGLTLECRGHGGSEAGSLRRLGFGTFASDLAAFAETLGGPVVVGGISMGAALALRLAVERPDLVSGLVLGRPAWVCEARPENMAPYALVGELLARCDPALAREAFEASDTARRLAKEAPDNLASLRGFFSREPVAVTRALLLRLAADDPGVSEEAIRALRVPTLVVGHGRDLAHPLIHAETLAGMIPGARLVRITPKAESRERYVADVRTALAEFLTEVSE
ncbi:hydrolase, alpha/beta fold protein family [Rubellimicrobium mesophilum DSM 19309]|uniref:Hydrolase, alpha/beta fold protein family n=1 Tax=Rubellimicrobium mesophilum DSM 19309 TaxID=442562 RepID=A0A017HSB6_9RHOB|nr:hydrolase, alpha/beta fold protein family [Rubellimicrobium mesophilum DSM 19309]